MDTSQLSAESLNPLLEERLALLKKERLTEAAVPRIQQTVDFLNAILFGVIHHHAPDYNAVRVGFNFDPSRERKDLIVHGEGQLDEYVTEWRKQHLSMPEIPSPSFMFFHLPYRDARDVPANEAKSMPTLEFAGGYLPRHAPATLVVDLNGGYGGLLENKVGISLEELSLVELYNVDNDSHFCPEFNGKSFKPANSALGHYLAFRGFVPPDFGILKELDKIPDETVRDRVKGLVEHILVPSEKEKLLGIIHEGTDRHILNGYFAVKDPDGIVLYKLGERITPSLSETRFGVNAKHVYAADIAARHRAGETPTFYSSVYRGHEAVKQLHENKAVFRST